MAGKGWGVLAEHGGCHGWGLCLARTEAKVGQAAPPVPASTLIRPCTPVQPPYRPIFLSGVAIPLLRHVRHTSRCTPGPCMHLPLPPPRGQARYFLGAHARCGLDEASALMGALYCNSLTLYSPHPDTDGASALSWATPREVGIGVSSSIAMLNHSCEHNAAWELHRGAILIRALRRIEPKEEITICYVDPRLPYEERKARLAEAFFFQCTCAACQARVARWSCARCGAENQATAGRCGARGCDGKRGRDTMPLPGAKRGRRRATPPSYG
jgi:hypothetical protein